MKSKNQFLRAYRKESPEGKAQVRRRLEEIYNSCLFQDTLLFVEMRLLWIREEENRSKEKEKAAS